MQFVEGEVVVPARPPKSIGLQVIILFIRPVFRQESLEKQLFVVEHKWMRIAVVRPS